MEIIKPHAVNSLNNFIAGWYISKKTSNRLLSAFLEMKDKWQPKLSPRNYSGLDIFELELNLIEDYFNQIQECLIKYINIYPHANDYNKYILTEGNLQYFSPGDYYDVYHHENSGDKESLTRHLVFITYLNDIKTGGDTEFLYQKIKIKPEQGLTIIWPCHWTHTHKGTATPEDKFISTGWFNFVYE